MPRKEMIHFVEGQTGIQPVILDVESTVSPGYMIPTPAANIVWTDGLTFVNITVTFELLKLLLDQGQKILDGDVKVETAPEA